MELFRAENIVKRYAKHTALDDVSISVEEGKIFGLLGPNGAGKTTLIRIINQITAPDEGHVFFGDTPLCSKHIENIGYLPEERGLYKKMKVGEQALYLARLKGLDNKSAKKQLKDWFEKFEISTWWDKKVEELSKGMQQKVQFITTVLHKPKLLIFDEPFSGFDPINANRLKQEILDLKEQGSTIIFSTHNMSSVEELCDHIALINNSKKILDGNITEIRQNYRSDIFEVGFGEKFNKMDLAINANYEIIEIKKQGQENKVKLHLKNKMSSNELLQQLMTAGEISSFKEMLPTMNDIFIKAVENN